MVGPTVGELLNSGAKVYMFNALTKFTGLWFPFRERIIATAFILIANFCGNLTTNWYLYFTPNNVYETFEEAYNNFRYYFDLYWIALATFNFVILFVFLFAFRAAPDQIPSKS